MFRIHHPTHFRGVEFQTVTDAILAFLDAGCPSDRVEGISKGAWIETSRGPYRSMSLFPALPDVFAGMDRAESRAAHAGGLRPWTYASWWRARVAEGVAL